MHRLRKLHHAGEVIFKIIFFVFGLASYAAIFWELYRYLSTGIFFALAATTAIYLVVSKHTGLDKPSKMTETVGIGLVSVTIGTMAALNLVSVYVVYQSLPKRLTIASLVIFSPYILYNLPYKSIWDLCIRDLEPHRQWRLQRIAMHLLQKTRFIPKSRLVSPSRKLPTEVWSLIIDHVLEVPFYFDTACEAKDFNRFIIGQGYDMRHELVFELYWGRLRSVCRSWKDIVDQRPARSVGFRAESMKFGSSLIRVDLNANSYQNVGSSQRSFLDRIAGPTTQPIAPTILVIDKHALAFYAYVPEFFKDHILPHAPKLGSVRSLVFPSESTIPDWFLPELQQSFSRLTFLRLEGRLRSGHLTLEQLEILYLDVGLDTGFHPITEPFDISSWWFPNLRHLALGKNHFKGQKFSTDLIPAPPDQILSLLLLPNHLHPIIRISKSFWVRMPSLRFLGVPLESIEVVNHAPLDHPLVHFCIPGAHFQWQPSPEHSHISKHRKRVTNIVTKIPNLGFLTMPHHDNLESHYTPKWRALFRAHKARGVVWLNSHGGAIDGSRRPGALFERMKPLLIAVYGCLVGALLLPRCEDGSGHSLVWFMTLWSPCLLMMLIHHLNTLYEPWVIWLLVSLD